MARYVKVLIDKGRNEWGHNGYLTINELKLFIKDDVNIALNKPVKVSSGESLKQRMVDGKIGNGSQWATDKNTGLVVNGSQWAEIDLQEDYYIEKIEFTTINDAGTGGVSDYRIMFSADSIDYWLATQVIDKPIVTGLTRTDVISSNEINNGNKMICKSSKGECWGMINGTLTQLTSNWDILSVSEKEEILKQAGYEKLSKLDSLNIDKFKFISYSRSNSKPFFGLIATPYDQLITSKGLINISKFESIDNIKITSTVTTPALCKMIVTTDLTTYKTYDFILQAWQDIDHTDLVEVGLLGIDAAKLTTIPSTAWNTLVQNQNGLGFAYLLSQESTADTCSVDKLQIQADMKGSWDKSIHGTEYKYGYPANNVLSVKLLTNGDYKINYSGS